MRMINHWRYNDISGLLEDFKDRAYIEFNGKEWLKLMRISLAVWKAHFSSGAIQR